MQQRRWYAIHRVQMYFFIPWFRSRSWPDIVAEGELAIFSKLNLSRSVSIFFIQIQQLNNVVLKWNRKTRKSDSSFWWRSPQMWLRDREIDRNPAIAKLLGGVCKDASVCVYVVTVTKYCSFSIQLWISFGDRSVMAKWSTSNFTVAPRWSVKAVRRRSNFVEVS